MSLTHLMRASHLDRSRQTDFEVGAGSTVTRSRQTEPLSSGELST